MSWRKMYHRYVLVWLALIVAAGVVGADDWRTRGALLFAQMAGLFLAHAIRARCHMKAEQREEDNARQVADLLTYCSQHPEIGEEDRCNYDD